MGRGTIFGPSKGLRIADGPMARLGTSATSDKKARPDADCLPDGRRTLSPKSEKGFRSAWGPGGRGSVSLAAFGKRKRGVGRPGAGRGC